MPSTVFQHTDAGENHSRHDGVHLLAHHRALYIISEHDYVHSLDCLPKRDSSAPLFADGPAPRPSLPLSARRRPPRPLMATLTYSSHEDHQPFGGPPGSPPDLTNSKSSKSSSFHSSNHSDFGPGDLSNLSHFEDINLDEASSGPSAFPLPLSPSNRVIFEGSRPVTSSGGRSLSAHHSVRDLTSTAKSRLPSLTNNAGRQPAQLAAPGKQFRRGFTSPSAPTLTTLGLAAPNRSSPSPSPSSAGKSPIVPRTLSRKSSRNMDVLPSPSANARRQSWQDAKRKTVKEREAECDDEGDDELPEDAFIWNVPISPRPMQERTPSSCGSMPSPNPDVASQVQPASRKPSPAPSRSRHSSRPSPRPSPSPSTRGNSPSTQLATQPTNTWDQIHTTLDTDAKVLTEALEVFQTEFEKKQEIKLQQPGLTRSASLNQPEPKAKKSVLPPVRKSDPLIDPFQPSAEKQKYLSRTRPSWLPPKNPKEEKKHLKEYQKMLARIEEAERLEAQRAQEEALAREKATRIKAEYWTTLLLPNWATEMTDPALRATHRKMWWNGIPPRLRGQVWTLAIGNDLEVSEATYHIALKKASPSQHITDGTRAVWPDLKMFAPDHPLHTDLINLCLAYSTYRPDISSVLSSMGIQHIAALLLLNLAAPKAFIALANLLNRPLPLSFLVNDPNAMHAAYSTTLHALAKKSPALAARLETLRVEPALYLAPMFASLFCNRLGVEHAARVMDVYVFEGDKIPPRVAVALLGALEAACLEGDARHVAGVLAERALDKGVDGFMDGVFEAGKCV